MDARRTNLMDPIIARDGKTHLLHVEKLLSSVTMCCEHFLSAL
jgi:hypothetical protein